MKQRIFGWISVLVGIVMALAAIEVTAIVWLYLEDGRYTPAEELFQRTQNTYVRDSTKGTACRYVDTLYPHPYLAFVHHANPPCGLPYINNIGLLGTDFPTIKPADRYVVLLVGGSVASQLAQNQPPPAPRYLEEELNKRYVSPNGKPLLVLNGGDGAWKEPQSFILFSMYATSVDAVITLSGYNEHYYFRPYTDERLEAPASQLPRGQSVRRRREFRRRGDRLGDGPHRRHAGAQSRARPFARRLHDHPRHRGGGQGQGRLQVQQADDAHQHLRPAGGHHGNGDSVFATQLALYQKYARAIEAVAKDNNVKTAYFLQPVPSWGKTLTEEEKRGVGDLSYRDLYRRMVEGMMTLRERGMAIFDLGDIFAKETGTIYADHIHYLADTDGESPGNRLMAARIGELLAETWGLQRKP